MTQAGGSFSVVIPHFGDPGPTREVVERMLSEPVPELRDIIVVDDCSPVPLGPIEGATVFRRASNGGFGAAVNSGAALATGEHLLVLNSDLELSPSAAQDLLRAAESLQPAVVSPRVVAPDGAYQWVGRRFPTLVAQAVEWATPLARFRNTRLWHRVVGHQTDGTSQAVTEVDWVAGAAMLIPLTHFRSIHGFDEGFFMNSEEVDLQRRLRNRGVRAYEVDSVEAVHEGGGSSDPGRRRQWLVTSRLRYARKWRGTAAPTRVMLSFVTLLNFAVNSIRQAFGREMQAIHVLKRELALLWTAERPRGVRRSGTGVE